LQEAKRLACTGRRRRAYQGDRRREGGNSMNAQPQKLFSDMPRCLLCYGFGLYPIGDGNLVCKDHNPDHWLLKDFAVIIRGIMGYLAIRNPDGTVEVDIEDKVNPVA
jgi:hypothetical protein